MLTIILYKNPTFLIYILYFQSKKKKNLRVNLHVFNKSIKTNLKLTTLKETKNFQGEVRYSPPASKEWKNTIYLYNNNNTIPLPLYNLSINSLIEHYFNLRFFPKFISKKYKPRWVRRPSMNKIYVSNAEIKHTNAKALLTVYAFNREKISLWKRFTRIKKRVGKRIEALIIQNKVLLDDLANKRLIKALLIKELKILRKYKLRLNLNKYKFEEKLLFKLNNIIGRYFNKRVEFNIININSVVSNSDIMTKVLSHKLWKKRIRTLKMMKYILGKAVVSKVNRAEKNSVTKSGVNLNLIENKYKNLTLTSVLINEDFNTLLKEVYKDISLNDNIDKDKVKMYNLTMDNIKYKKFAGIRLETKGRITRRFKAERAQFKVKWKGTLKNISCEGLSDTKFRGYLNSNVEYSILAHKRRIGAFAVKGWISGK